MGQTKEEWKHFVHWKDVDDVREVGRLFFQPIFAEKRVLSSQADRVAYYCGNFMSADREAEEASWRAQKEIARLAAKGWVAEMEEPIFYD